MARFLVTSLGHFDRAELSVCRLLNRSSRLAAIRHGFSLISWLGNGWLWYGLIAVQLAQNGRAGVYPGIHMLLTGVLGVGIYTLIKEYAVRERPFVSDGAIRCACAPLDRYSFPSGHTLHAVSFSLMLAHYCPGWGPTLIGFTVSIAMSRVILGLHYPSDVAAGAVLGGGLAVLGLKLAAIG